MNDFVVFDGRLYVKQRYISDQGWMKDSGLSKTFKDQSAHKPQIHQVYYVLLSVRTKLRSHTTDLGPCTSTILRKETDGRRWYTDNDKKELVSVLASAIAKADRYLDLLHYAKSARLFDPRQRPKLSRDVAQYTTEVEDIKRKVTDPKRAQVRVIPIGVKIPEAEWEYYWDEVPEMEGTLDLIDFWERMQPHMPTLAKLALRTLPVPHTGVDVERSFSYYKLCRSAKQERLTSERHVGRVSFAMNGVVPPVKEAPRPA